MNRRQLLKILGFGAVTTVSVPLLQACAPAAAPAQKPADASKPAEAAKPAAGKPSEASKPAQQAPSASSGPVKRGGTLNVLIQNDWTTLDPNYNSAEPNGINMIYGEWVRWERGEDGQWGPHPEMFAEWDLKPDVITFKLQKGVTFHDGTPWDAKAAKWNLDRMIFDKTSRTASYWTAVDRSAEDGAALEAAQETSKEGFEYTSKAVEVVGEDTVRLRVTAPMPATLVVLSNALQNNNPVSPEAFKKAGAAEFSRNPVGAGPYRFVEWKSGSHVTLERNPTYWRQGSDGQALPYIDKIQYRLIIDDSARLLEMKSGSAQFMELVQGKDIASIKSDPNLTFIESESSGNQYRFMFCASNPNTPFTKHKKLRQAALYALDREAMAKTLGFGFGFGRKYLLPKGELGYDDTESRPFYWYDKAKAQSLIKEVIAEDASVAGSDGVVPASMLVADRAVDKQQAEMMKQMLDSVGFKTNIEILERAALGARIQEKPGQPGGFEIATMRNPVAPSDPDNQWRSFFHSASTGAFQAQLNDSVFDKLIDEAATTYDIERRQGLYKQLDERSFEEAWYAWLWQQNWNWLHSKKLQNFREPITNRWLFTETWLA